MKKREQIVFDLVDGEHEADRADGGPGPRPGPGGGPLRGLGPAIVSGMVRARDGVSRHRTASLITTGVASVVVLALAGVGTAREQERVELLRAAPGGVESLAAPPAETWRYAPDGDTNLLGRYGLGTDGIEMDGNVVFFEGEQSRLLRARFDAPNAPVRWKEADLVALDAGTGAEAWRVPLGADPQCTPAEATSLGIVSAEELVCLVGNGDDRSAVVVTADGGTTEPRLLAEDGFERVGETIPGPGGLVVRAWFDGDAPEIDCANPLLIPDSCRTTTEPDRVVIVSAVDARTGDERWHGTAPWTGDTFACVRDRRGNGTPELDVSALSVTVWSGRIHVQGCGVDEAFLPDGTAVRTGSLISRFDDLVVEENYAAQVNGPTTTVRTADGAKLFSAAGWVTTGEAGDGTPAEIIVVADPQGGSAQGFRRDGTVAWKSEDASGTMVARTGETGLFQPFDSNVLGIDLSTGERVWEWTGKEAGLGAGATRMPGAFTDGETVLMVYNPGPLEAEPDTAAEGAADGAGRQVDLVALDARSGHIRWNTEHDDHTWFAVGGHLLSLGSDGSLAGHQAG
ncbi:hypothetical protein GCM10028784_35160 [Myceligenerans cantabricum]